MRRIARFAYQKRCGVRVEVGHLGEWIEGATLIPRQPILLTVVDDSGYMRGDAFSNLVAGNE